MQNIRVLEMINNNQIEELKVMLRDEIYADLLKKKPGASKRYSAMKRYFTFVDTEREILQKPCLIEYEGLGYMSFCNSYSVALTKEPCGAIEMFTDVDRYPDVSRLIRKEGDEIYINFPDIFARARLDGYRLIKAEANTHKFKYLLKVRNSYFKLGLVDATFSIINEGEPAKVYISNDPYKPMTIETGIGICTIMPMRIDEVADHHILIEAEEVTV